MKAKGVAVEFKAANEPLMVASKNLVYQLPVPIVALFVP